MKCSGIAKRWDTKTQQKKNISSNWKRSVPYSPFTSKNDSYLVKDASCFLVLKRNPFLFFWEHLWALSAPKDCIQKSISGWILWISQFINPSKKPKKITCKSPMWSCCTHVTILSLEKKNWQIKTNQTQFAQKIHLFLRAPKTDGAPTVLEFCSAFFGNFMYIIRPTPRWWPERHVSPGTFLLFLHLHAVSNEVGTHGTQKASGIPGPRPRLEGTKTSRWVISLEMIERKTKRYGQFYKESKQCPPSQVKLW